MAGILIAKLLKDSGMEPIVVEADKVGGGNTAGTTAKITVQHGLTYADIAKTMGLVAAQKYADANKDALGRFIKLAKGIDCDFRQCPAYVYTLRDTDILERERDTAEMVGIQAEVTTKTELPFPVEGALKFEGQATFHPLKFLQEISRDLTVYEQTQASEVKDGVIDAAGGKIKAKHIVVATHYPFINFPGYYFLRMHQSRTYMLALENAATIDGMYIDADEGGNTFRGYGDILLFGGEGHRTGRNKMSGRYERLVKAAQNIIRLLEIARWSTGLCNTG